MGTEGWEPGKSHGDKPNSGCDSGTWPRGQERLLATFTPLKRPQALIAHLVEKAQHAEQMKERIREPALLGPGLIWTGLGKQER